MNRSVFPILALLLMSFSFAGCSVTTPLTPPLVNEEYLTHPDRFEVVGDVKGEATVGYLLWIIPTGLNRGYHSAYMDAIQNAKKIEGSELINVYADQRYTVFLFGLYISRTTIIHAKAVHKFQ